jgi:MFS family permease
MIPGSESQSPANGPPDRKGDRRTDIAQPLSQTGPRPPSRLRRNLVYCTWDGILAVPATFLAAPGNVVITVLLTQYFHLSTLQFGVIVSLQAACNALQVMVLPWLTHHYTPKQMSVFGAWAQWTAFLGLAAMVGGLPRSESPWIFPVLLTLFLVLAATQALIGISWTSWVQEFTPERIRGKYFGRRNMFYQSFTILYLLAAGSWLEWSGQGHIITLRDGLIALIGCSMLVRAGSIRMQHLTCSPLDLRPAPAATNNAPLRAWTAQLKQVVERRNLMAYFVFGASFGFASSLMGPFFNVFMLDVLGMSAMQVMTAIVLSSITGALSMAAWGRMIDRFGNRPVMAFCLVVWMCNGYGWIFTTPDRLWILYLIWAVAGIFASGFVQGLFGLLLKIIPPESKTLAISINTAATALPAAIAPVIGGALLNACINHGWDKLTVYQCGSAIHHTLVLLTVLLLLRVHEPKAQPLGQLVGAMRSYRQVASILGLSFLTNYIFFRKK